MNTTKTLNLSQELLENEMTKPLYNMNEVDDTKSAEFLEGEWANYAGKPYDQEASAEWQAGWDSAQVTREEWEELCEASGDGFVLE